MNNTKEDSGDMLTGDALLPYCQSAAHRLRARIEDQIDIEISDLVHDCWVALTEIGGIQDSASERLRHVIAYRALQNYTYRHRQSLILEMSGYVDGLSIDSRSLLPYEEVPCLSVHPRCNRMSPEEEMMEQEKEAHFTAAFDVLYPVEKAVLSMSYGIGRPKLTYKEIGYLLGMSSSRVGQIVDEAREVLRCVLSGDDYFGPQD